MSIVSRCLISIFLIVLSCSSVNLAAHQTDNYSQYLKRLSTDDGLSQSSVTQIVQDDAGFIWLGTEMGLNRFDGYRVKKIPGPNLVFSKEYITALLVDNDGFIWVATAISGLYRLDPNTLAAEKYYSLISGPLNQDPVQILSLKQGTGNTLWLGMTTGTSRLNISTYAVTETFLLDDPNIYVRDVLIDDTSLYSATSRGIYVTDINTHVSRLIEHRPTGLTSREASHTKILAMDPTLGLLVGTMDGLYAIDENNKRQKLIADLNIWDLTRHHDHYMVSTNNGLYQFDPDTLKLTFVLKFSDSNYNTKDNNIFDTFLDRVGNFWFATNSQGAMLWAPQTTYFSLPGRPKLSNENVWSIYADNRDTLWVGSDNGLFKMPKNAKSATAYLTQDRVTSDEPTPMVNAIYPDSIDANYLWLSKSDGLYRFNKLTAALTPAPFNENEKDKLGGLWLSGLSVLNNEHIFFFNNDGHFKFDATTGTVIALTTLDDIAAPSLSVTFHGQLPGRKNSVLLAVSGRLLEYNYKLDRVNTIYEIEGFRPQAYDYVDSWVVDNHNTLWLSVTGEGLIGLDAISFEKKYRIGVTDGLMTSEVYRIELDDSNNLWLSSQQGLHRVNTTTLAIDHFNASDGLVSEEFNGGASTKLSDGSLIFGSPLGLVQFSAAHFNYQDSDKHSFPVAITDVEISSNDRKLVHIINAENQITLNHNDIGLRLKFSTLQYHKQEQVTYDIKLSGTTNYELSVEHHNELTLPKLSPGHYTLKISAQSPATVHPTTPLVLDIEVLHAPWFTSAAKSLYVLFLLALALSIRIVVLRRRSTLLAAHAKVRASKQQMELALKSSDSGVWDYNIASNELYQARITLELGYDDELSVKGLAFHASIVSPRHYSTLKAKWIEFIRGSDENWDVTYQLKHRDNAWVWYRDTGRVIERDENGKPTRVSGTYTNINRSKVVQEQAILLGQAFSKINDGVLVLDRNKKPVTANDAFIDSFGINGGSINTGWKDLVKRLSDANSRNFSDAIDQMQVTDAWQGEAFLEIVESEHMPVLLKINAVGDNVNVLSHYVIVISDITVQKKAEGKLRRLAHYDYLTDLPKRQLVIDKIDQLIIRDKQCALFFIDIDRFKQVNDLYGHNVGDSLLRQISKILLHTVDYYDMVARHNGDEFMVLITTTPTPEKLSYLARRIISQIATPIVIEGQQLNISACIGIATFPAHCQSAREMIKHADLAMNYAKKNGRGQFQFFTEYMVQQAQSRLLLEDQLRLACDSNQFINYYQPIVDNVKQQVIGIELLLRWQQDQTLVSPAKFIPIAEEIGLISQMTIAAIDRALVDYLTLPDTLDSVYISVNLSPIHILQEGLNDGLNRLLVKYQLPASVLRLEITEGTLLADLDIALLRLNELQASGFKLLLDDFGTGYSSLTYLSRFPVNVIKIDQSFVMNFDKKPQDKQIIEAIISLADNLTLECIAEGVETKAQLDFLNDIGCRYIQGYYFAKPMPIDVLHPYLAQPFT